MSKFHHVLDHCTREMKLGTGMGMHHHQLPLPPSFKKKKAGTSEINTRGNFVLVGLKSQAAIALSILIFIKFR